MGRDPFEGIMTIPLSLAKYPYVHGNPINATDPSGLLLLPELLTDFATQILRNTQPVKVGVRIIALATALSYAFASFGRFSGGVPGVSRERTPMYVEDYEQAFQVSKAQIERCALWNDINCRTSLPIQVYTAKNFADHSRHIDDAQKGRGDTKTQSHLQIPSILNVQEVGRPKYNSQPQCNPSARNAYEQKTGKRGACDEYPYQTTLQGGQGFYDLGLVSLRLVDPDESNRQGRFVEGFYTWAMVNPGRYSTFGVITDPNNYATPSFWINRDGETRPFLEGA